MKRFLDALDTFLEELVYGDRNSITIDHTDPSPIAQNDPVATSSPQIQQIPNPDTLTSDWTTQKGTYHNVRVLCDLAGLTLEEKNTLCACIYQESTFYNYLPDGNAVKHANLNGDGSVASTDWGLCQINDYYHIGITKDFPSVAYVLANPEAVVKWMIGMYQDGLLSQWDSYLHGSYRQWLLPASPMWLL